MIQIPWDRVEEEQLLEGMVGRHGARQQVCWSVCSQESRSPGTCLGMEGFVQEHGELEE